MTILERVDRRAAHPPGPWDEALPIAVALRELAGGAVPGATDRLLSATLALGPSAAPDPTELFGAALRAGLEASLWLQPHEGFALVGLGRAWSVEAAGPGRFEAIAEAWRRRLDGARLRNDGGRVRGTGPLLLGGLGFTGDRPTDARWVPFGAASLVLPQLLLAWAPGGAWLTASLVAPEGDDPADLETLWRRLARRSAAASRDRSAAASPSARLTVVGEQPDRPTWNRLVGSFAGAVGRGRLDKVVLARRVDLGAWADIDAVDALRRLAATAPETTTYAVARGGIVFLGATPERLVRTEGAAFRTVAVAGSIRRGADAAEDAALAAELLASEKDREEHEIVVQMLRSTLAPIAERLTVAAEPTVVAHRTVHHLVTPVTGRLRDRTSILALARRLHPTPAVGGEPRDLALELIAEHEGFDRGWYAAPLGWVGTDGDGEFVVALRCAVVSGTTASLFAGCGIVADSDPDREWEESRIKLEVVAAALGELRP